MSRRGFTISQAAAGRGTIVNHKPRIVFRGEQNLVLLVLFKNDCINNVKVR